MIVNRGLTFHKVTDLLERIQLILSDPDQRQKIKKSYDETFKSLNIEDHRMLAEEVIHAMNTSTSLQEMWEQVQALWHTHPTIERRSVFDQFPEMFAKRIEIIAGQTLPYLKGMKTVCDFGAGKGDFSRRLVKEGYLVEAWDVIRFPHEQMAYPVRQFDGYTLPDVADQQYDGTVLTNVLHHEKDNEKILELVSRITRKRLVVIETVPDGKTPDEISLDWPRTFMCDVLWNTLFNNIHTPVPGTYDTGHGWMERIQKYGFDCKHYKDLGYDQPSIHDRHVLMVFER